jgi:MFS family permease
MKTAKGLRNAVEALRYPDFKKFWIGALISNCGTWMQNVSVPYVIYQSSGSSTLVGLTGFFQFIPTLFLAPIGGWLGDRHSRRMVLIVTQTMQALLAFALYAMYLSGVRRASALIAVVFVSGIVQGLNVPAWQAFVSELVPREVLLNAVTLNSAQFNASRAIGPALAGLVLGAFGASWAFLLNALSYIAVLVALAAVRAHPVANGDAGERQPLVAQVRSNLRYVRRTRGIVVALGLLVVMAGLGQTLLSLMPVYAGEVFHVDAWRYGLMSTAIGAGGVIGAVVLGSLRRGTKRGTTVRRTVILYSIALAAVGLAPVYLVGVATLAASGMLYLMVIAPLNTTVQMLAPDHLRAGVIAIYVMTFNFAYPVGALAQGALAEAVGARTTIVASAAIIFGAAAAALARGSFASLDDDVGDHWQGRGSEQRSDA